MHSGLDRLRTPESCLIEPNKPRVPAMEPPRMSSIRRNCRTSGAKKWMCLGILVSKRRPKSTAGHIHAIGVESLPERFDRLLDH